MILQTLFMQFAGVATQQFDQNKFLIINCDHLKWHRFFYLNCTTRIFSFIRISLTYSFQHLLPTQMSINPEMFQVKDGQKNRQKTWGSYKDRGRVKNGRMKAVRCAMLYKAQRGKPHFTQSEPINWKIHFQSDKLVWQDQLSIQEVPLRVLWFVASQTQMHSFVPKLTLLVMLVCCG